MLCKKKKTITKIEKKNQKTKCGKRINVRAGNGMSQTVT